MLVGCLCLQDFDGNPNIKAGKKMKPGLMSPETQTARRIVIEHGNRCAEHGVFHELLPAQLPACLQSGCVVTKLAFPLRVWPDVPPTTRNAFWLR